MSAFPLWISRSGPGTWHRQTHYPFHNEHAAETAVQHLQDKQLLTPIQCSLPEKHNALEDFVLRGNDEEDDEREPKDQAKSIDVTRSSISSREKGEKP